MKILKIITIVLLAAISITEMYSQGKISIHAGSSFPVLDFASDEADNVDGGGAAVGVNVGLRYLYPLSQNGLGLFAGIDINYNGIKQDIKDDLKEQIEAIGISNANYKFPKYINIPLTAGLDYSYQVNDKVGVFANVGLALNFLKITDMEIELNGQTVATKMDLANSIGFKIGGGILIKQNISVAIDYFGLGEHDMKGEVIALGYTDKLDAEGKIDFLTLTLGFVF